MNEDKKALCKEYADLEAQKKEIEERQKAIKPEITGEMENLGVEQVKSDFGTFYFMTRKKWSYSDAVKSVEETLKNTKKQEEENGTAKAEESKTLAFKAK